MNVIANPMHYVHHNGNLGNNSSTNLNRRATSITTTPMALGTDGCSGGSPSLCAQVKRVYIELQKYHNEFKHDCESMLLSIGLLVKRLSASSLCDGEIDVVLANPKSETYVSSKHQFLLITRSHPQRMTEDMCVVCADFRQFFAIARPSDEYSKLLACLCDVFIGTIEELHQVIDFMVTESAKSFMRNEMPLPPWREAHILRKHFDISTITLTPTTILPLTRTCDVGKLGSGTRSVVLLHASKQSQKGTAESRLKFALLEAAIQDVTGAVLQKQTTRFRRLVNMLRELLSNAFEKGQEQHQQHQVLSSHFSRFSSGFSAGQHQHQHHHHHHHHSLDDNRTS